MAASRNAPEAGPPLPTVGDARALDPPVTRGRAKAVRDAAGAAVGAALGLLPHVLHHAGLIAGAALVTGATGNALFFLAGLVFSLPLLRRLQRRFSSWWAPATAVVVFAGLFTFSAVVLGPALTGGASSDDGPATPVRTPPGHDAHHGG